MPKKNRYSAILEKLFSMNYKEGAATFEFKRTDIEKVAKTLKIDLPKNLGDLIYSFRYRVALPERIQSKAPKGQAWIIRPAGSAKYRFDLVADRPLAPHSSLAITKFRRRLRELSPSMLSQTSRLC